MGIGAALAVALSPTLSAANASPTPSAPSMASVGDPKPVALNVNGKSLTLTLEPRVTLLDALREYAGLTGTKKGCDHGQCGACTVHIDGRRVLSCLTLAMMAQGKHVTTIEGLARGDELHPVQQAFIDHDGFQCGYCTPGQIMSAVALLREPCGPSDADVRESMSGNLCRCGAYPNIVAAIQEIRAAAPPNAHR
jgi:xanthine dehydrogenase YagT iron-sulfur-binding subunit